MSLSLGVKEVGEPTPAPPPTSTLTVENFMFQVPLFRKLLSSSSSFEHLDNSLSDLDCCRFIKSNKGNIDNACAMAIKWWEWRFTVMEGRIKGVTPDNILDTTQTDNLCNHPHRHLLPHALVRLQVV